MPMKMDRDQWTDMWEHRQENSLCCDSEVKWGNRIVRVKWCSHFQEKQEFVCRYLVSMGIRCSLRPPRSGILILRCLPSYLIIIKRRRRDVINIKLFTLENLLSLYRLLLQTLSLTRQSPSTIKIIGLSYLASLSDRLPPNTSPYYWMEIPPIPWHRPQLCQSWHFVISSFCDHYVTEVAQRFPRTIVILFRLDAWYVNVASKPP